MAKQTVVVSDLSGEVISGPKATVKIDLESKPNSSYAVDASEDEVAELVSKARETKRRGRRPGK